MLTALKAAKTKLAGYRSFFVVASVYIVLVQVSVLVTLTPGGLGGEADHRMLYAAGYLVRTGHGAEIYSDARIAETEARLAGTKGASLPYNHPAYEALAYAPLSFASYKTAYAIFFALNVAMLAGIYFLLAPSTWLGEVWNRLPVVTLAGFLPVGMCLVQGQDSILLLFCLACSYALQKRGREFGAGIALGLGLFRFQIVIPLMVLLLFARRWKLLAGFGVACAAAVAVSLGVTGPASWLTYPKYLAATSSGMLDETTQKLHGILPVGMPNLRGLMYLIFGGWGARAGIQILTLLASVALMAWAVWKRLPFALMVVIALLVGYHGYIHDSVVLLMPLLTSQIEGQSGDWKKLVGWGAAAAGPTLVFATQTPYAVMAAVYLIFAMVMVRAGGTWRVEETAAAGDSKQSG